MSTESYVPVVPVELTAEHAVLKGLKGGPVGVPCDASALALLTPEQRQAVAKHAVPPAVKRAVLTNPPGITLREVADALLAQDAQIERTRIQREEAAARDRIEHTAEYERDVAVRLSFDPANPKADDYGFPAPYNVDDAVLAKHAPAIAEWKARREAAAKARSADIAKANLRSQAERVEMFAKLHPESAERALAGFAGEQEVREALEQHYLRAPLRAAGITGDIELYEPDNVDERAAAVLDGTQFALMKSVLAAVPNAIVKATWYERELSDEEKENEISPNSLWLRVSLTMLGIELSVWVEMPVDRE